MHETTVSRISWEDAQRLAKKAPQRGFMGSASAIEIVLPDIAGTFADIQYFRKVPHALKSEYHLARSRAFAYGGDERREAAEALLDRVLAAVDNA